MKNTFFENIKQPNYNNYSNFIIPVEEFRVINFYGIKENMYSVSNYGRVFNIVSNKELAQANDQLNSFNSYKSVGLQMMDNSRKTFPVHRLVAMAFIPKIEEDIYFQRDFVNHKNLCRSYNVVWNLEWVTSDENFYHSNVFGPYSLQPSLVKPNQEQQTKNNWGKGTIGEKNGMSRVSDNQVHLICQGLVDGLSYQECAIKAGLEGTENDRFLISSIAQRRKRTDISQNYNFKDAIVQFDYSPYIVPICELLEQGYTVPQICKELNLDYNKARHTVTKIRDGKTYTDISQNYKW